MRNRQWSRPVLASAYGAGGVAVLGAAALIALEAEALWARYLIGNAVEDPPDPTGRYLADGESPQPALRLAVLGDSSAAGYGVQHADDTPGARLARRVAHATQRDVDLICRAKVGAQTKHLKAQIEAVTDFKPTVAVILIGGNDVTHGVPMSKSLTLLRQGLRQLEAAQISVVMGTCPDLGTIEPIGFPLKQVVRTWSRRLAVAQTRVLREERCRAVAIGSLLKDEFTQLSPLLFGPDRFHPSAAGYHRLAAALLPETLAALAASPSGPPAPAAGATSS